MSEIVRPNVFTECQGCKLADFIAENEKGPGTIFCRRIIIDPEVTNRKNKQFYGNKHTRVVLKTDAGSDISIEGYCPGLENTLFLIRPRYPVDLSG